MMINIKVLISILCLEFVNENVKAKVEFQYSNQSEFRPEFKRKLAKNIKMN